MIDSKQLQEIRERFDLVHNNSGSEHNNSGSEAAEEAVDQLWREDVPAMLAELERLNDPGEPTTVMLESPYAGDVEANEDYARRCMLDSIRRGEAPMVGHLLYTQVLRDANPTERKMGIRAHLAWLRRSKGVVLCTDRGTSPGMKEAIELGLSLGVPIADRKLEGYNG